MFSQVMDSADRNQRQFIVERDELADEAYELADEEGTVGQMHTHPTESIPIYQMH